MSRQRDKLDLLVRPLRQQLGSVAGEAAWAVLR